MGNRSTDRALRGVARTSVRLPGFLVQGTVCIPRAHPQSLWLLPWVEALLTGTPWASLMADPPWPAPSDVLVTRTLAHHLLDLRWAVPDWSGNAVTVAPHLAEAYRAGGRGGLARVLFDAELVPGEWWMEGAGGILLSRQTAAQFDWDHKRRADHVLEPSAAPDALLDNHPPDLPDLLRKLGGVESLWDARDRAFLAGPLTATEPKDILFTLVGEDLRLLPDELAEIEPSLTHHAPHLLGARKQTSSRVVALPDVPVEQLATELERLPVDPAALGPIAPVRDTVRRLADLVARHASSLADWYTKTAPARPVLGPTQRHFDAIHEVCGSLPDTPGEVVLITTAFLNPQHAGAEDGLADALAAAPPGTRFLFVYGHANDDLPEQQDRDCRSWSDGVVRRQPSLSGRLFVVPGKRRSHEKVIVSSRGHWMVGSWNAGSSRPHATVFEASLLGLDRRLAVELLDRIAQNIDRPAAAAQAEDLRDRLGQQAQEPEDGVSAVAQLTRAIGCLVDAVPEGDGTRDQAWNLAASAARAALHPFLTRIEAQLVDEQQTRDVFLALARSTRRDVLLTSDRLADSALDAATLRDLRGEGRQRRVVRVVWGREWAGRRATDRLAREQLQRARRTVREARELLGPALRTQDAPMENHAKVLVVDGRRGLVTSENLLSYGGEKGRYESRELGVAFWSPSIARHILGRMVLQWPEALGTPEKTRDDGDLLAWCVAGSEAWHGLAAVADELDFEWRTPAFLEEVVRDELSHAQDEETDARRQAFARLSERLGTHPFVWVQQEAARLGLLQPTDATWIPYDVAAGIDAATALARATDAVAALPPRRVAAVPPPVRAPNVVDPLLARVLAEMVEIPAGTFWMGDDRVPEERPRHQVTISRPFQMGRTPVTQGLWEAVMGRLPHLRDVERHPDFPIIHVSYAEMQTFLARLNALAGGGGFDLPTEAQWEYACRAGSEGAYCFGDSPGNGDRPGRLEEFAWTKRSSRARMHGVGELRPNAFGLHDMHGLVYETMRDGPRRYTREAVADPLGPMDGQRIVARGGFWGRFPIDPRRPSNEHFRCSSRQVYEKSHRVSFRIVRTVEGEG